MQAFLLQTWARRGISCGTPAERAYRIFVIGMTGVAGVLLLAL